MKVRAPLFAAAVTAAIAVPAAPASAAPVCVAVTGSGVVNLGVGPFCVATPFSTSCGFDSVSLGTIQTVVVDYCLP